MRYFARLSAGKVALWCYFIWYAFFVTRYFDPNRSLWLTSLGISAIVGVALLLSTRPANPSAATSARPDPWVVFRLFLMPFCVSSFSALVKGKGFVLIFSPRPSEDLFALGCCAVFCAFVAGVKFFRRSTPR